jgi:hypothetical protein
MSECVPTEIRDLYLLSCRDDLAARALRQQPSSPRINQQNYDGTLALHRTWGEIDYSRITEVAQFNLPKVASPREVVELWHRCSSHRNFPQSSCDIFNNCDV